MTDNKMGVRQAVRAVAAMAALVVLYYVAPLNGRLTVSTLLILTLELIILTTVIVWQIRSIIRSRFSLARAAQALAVSISLFLLCFAACYFVMASGDAHAFSQPLTRTDALYFTITVFATVGFGDIVPVAEVARITVMTQMILDLLLVSVVIKVFLDAIRIGRDRQATGPR